MGRKLFWLFVAFLLFFSFSSLIVKLAVAEVYTDVTVSQAKAMIEASPSLVLLDVRNQSEYDAGHIRNAKLIPVWQLAARLDELNKTDEILVYCSSGVRSANASSILVSNGFLHVFNMLEGINGWMAVGYPAYVRYSSIQEAINNATDGDTIDVSSGLYYENLVINKSLTLNGENVYTTIVDGRNEGNVISVEANYVTITGFMIQDSGCSCGDYAGVYSKPYYQNMNLTGNRIMNNNGYGVKLWWAQKVSIVYNEITNNSANGILLVGSYDNTVVGNNIAHNYYGLNLDASSNNTIDGNNIAHNYYGLDLDASSNNTIDGNNITDNPTFGVNFDTSDNNVFSQNNVEFMSYGVKMHYSSMNLLSGNRVGNNTIGIVLDNSTNNKVYHNSLNNDQQVQFQESGLTNVWDDGYPSGGNFWSDYKGADLYTGSFQNETGSDGIGDTPYVIDVNNTDNYSLMGAFSDFNVTLGHYVQTVSNSTISDFQFSGTAISFNADGENGITGFCRICIPTALINGTFTVFVNGTEISYTLLPESNSTHSYLYFTYSHSTEQIIIVPEFPSFLILPLFMIATLLAVMIYRKKGMKTR